MTDEADKNVMATGHATMEAPQDVDVFQALMAKVLAGEPIYIGGPLNSPIGAVHLRLIERLKAATGRAVTVVFH